MGGLPVRPTLPSLSPSSPFLSQLFWPLQSVRVGHGLLVPENGECTSHDSPGILSVLLAFKCRRETRWPRCAPSACRLRGRSWAARCGRSAGGCSSAAYRYSGPNPISYFIKESLYFVALFWCNILFSEITSYKSACVRRPAGLARRPVPPGRGRDGAVRGRVQGALRRGGAARGGRAVGARVDRRRRRGAAAAVGLGRRRRRPQDSKSVEAGGQTRWAAQM